MPSTLCVNTDNSDKETNKTQPEEKPVDDFSKTLPLVCNKTRLFLFNDKVFKSFTSLYSACRSLFLNNIPAVSGRPFFNSITCSLSLSSNNSGSSGTSLRRKNTFASTVNELILCSRLLRTRRILSSWRSQAGLKVPQTLSMNRKQHYNKWIIVLKIICCVNATYVYIFFGENTKYLFKKTLTAWSL